MTRHSRISGYVLLTIALVASVWSATLTFGGGVAIQSPWGRISSRDPVRPLALALAAGVLFVFLQRSRRVDHTETASSPWPKRVVLVLAALILVAGIRFGTFTAGGSDPSGYVSEALLWREARLVRPAPSWVAGAPWPDAEQTAEPLGYVRGAAALTQVPSYPAGLPLMMAVAHLVLGVDGEYYVVPICGALLVWSTFLLVARVSSPWGGVIAAALMASSPPFLMWLVMPMTDVPVATLWTIALVCGLAGTMAGAIGAGAATALAIVTRPNLAPLAAIVAMVIAVRQRGRVPGLLAFSGISATGAVIVGLLNLTLYGSAFRSGYGDLDGLYSLEYIWRNIQQYPSWFVATQTAIPLLGFLAPLTEDRRGPWRVLVLLTFAFPAAVVCLYLAYKPFDEWSYLRFLLPAYPPLFAGLSVVATKAGQRWRSQTTWVTPAIAFVVVLLVLRGLDYSNATTDLAASEPRYRHVAAAAGSAPDGAIFLSFQHSGSLRYYTGRDILRWDLMDPNGVDAALVYLEARGHRLFWVGDDLELETITRRFAGSRFLDRVTSATAEVIDGVRVVELGPPR